MPNQIQKRIKKKFPGLAPTEYPTLKQIQNRLGRTNKTMLDTVDNVNKFRATYIYSDQIGDDDPFCFGDYIDDTVGNGSDKDHFNLIMTTKNLLRKLDDKYQGCGHHDGTYKIVRTGYTLFVVGKTDGPHSFHPCAVGLTSHEKTPDFEWFLRAVKKFVVVLVLLYF